MHYKCTTNALKIHKVAVRGGRVAVHASHSQNNHIFAYFTTLWRLWRPNTEKSKLSQLLNHGTCWQNPGFIQQMETTTGTIDPFCVLVARVVGTEFGYMAYGA